jgi:hypothetical protein
LIALSTGYDDQEALALLCRKEVLDLREYVFADLTVPLLERQLLGVRWSQLDNASGIGRERDSYLSIGVEGVPRNAGASSIQERLGLIKYSSGIHGINNDRKRQSSQLSCGFRVKRCFSAH